MTTASSLGRDRLSAAQRRFALGGVNISCVDRPAAVDFLFQLVSTHAGGYLTVTDAHAIVASQSDPVLRDIINGAQLVLPDGMPSVWLGRLKGHAISRVAGADFIGSVFADPRARAVRHYFYGGDAQTVGPIVAAAERRLGGGAIAGWHAPPLREVGAAERDDVIAEMTGAAPDVIWVGLGAPKQEYWMANHGRLFPQTVLVGVGAALTFFAGLQARAPEWMQAAGLEWIFRLLQEPKRLWPRYSRVVPGMLRIMIAEAIRR